MAPRRMLEPAAIGTATGLFGVGGGAAIVPVLVLRLGYADRAAMGTSLAAIAVIAGAATPAQGAYGNVHVDDGLPAHRARSRRTGRNSAWPRTSPARS